MRSIETQIKFNCERLYEMHSESGVSTIAMVILSLFTRNFAHDRLRHSVLRKLPNICKTRKRERFLKAILELAGTKKYDCINFEENAKSGTTMASKRVKQG